MMRARTRAIGSEQGAVFVQVGISLFVLMAFNVFVLDYGMMWIGRRQAQNAADAGALAERSRAAYDDFAIRRRTAWPLQSAEQVARPTSCGDRPATPVVTLRLPGRRNGRCVRVDVYRNGENGSTPMPTLFGPILGITSQGVRATATAIAGERKRHQLPSADCLRRRLERTASADQPVQQLRRNDWGSRYLATRDAYTPPSATQAGSTTFRATSANESSGSSTGQPRTPTPITRWARVVALDLPGGRPLSSRRLTICNGQPVELRSNASSDRSRPAPATTGAGFA